MSKVRLRMWSIKLACKKGRKFLELQFIIFCLMGCFSTTTFAHFGIIIPSESVIDQHTGSRLKLVIGFSHPFLEEGISIEKPEKFGVSINGRQDNLLNSLKETVHMGHKAWAIDYNIQKPAVYQFYMVLSPYWESAEDCFIIHYTKLIIPAFCNEEGWDKEVGLKAEIVPLTRPFGLYAGNTFQGIVKKNGKIVPFADVEVNYYNKGKRIVARNSYLESQSLKCDQNGIFTYSVPAPGWWGFKAFVPPDKQLKYNGVPKKTYLGAIIWVFFEKWN